MNAQDADAYSTGCDPAYMRTLNQKAAMEAQREVATFQTFIKKADSVLAYTCFFGLLDHASATIGPIFSESFFTPSTPPNYGGNRLRLERDLDATVGIPVRSYLIEAFGHGLFGGIPDIADPSATSVLTPNSMAMGNKTHLTSRDIGGAVVAAYNTGWPVEDNTYTNCAIMDRVFELARCIDANENDFFYLSDFKEPGEEESNPAVLARRMNAFEQSVSGNLNTAPDKPPFRYGAGSGDPGNNSFRHSFSCSDGQVIAWETLMLQTAFNETPQDAPDPDIDLLYDFRSFLDPEQGEEKYPDGEAQFDEPWFAFFERGEEGCGDPIATGAVYFTAGTGEAEPGTGNAAGRGCVVDGFCAVPGCEYTPNVTGGSLEACEELQKQEQFQTSEIGQCN